MKSFSQFVESKIQISQGEVAKFLTGDNFQGLEGYLYDSITRRAGWQQDHSDLSQQNPEIKNAFNQMTASSDASNPAWSQWTLFDNPKEEGSNFKLYYSPSVDKVSEFISNFADLVERLKQDVLQFKTDTSIKTPNTFSGFVGSNDRIVIHFKKKEAATVFDSTVKKWAQDHQIPLDQRTHTFGQDDKKTGSYGQRIAANLAKLASEYKSQGYNVNQLTTWVIQSFQKLLTDIR